MHLTNILLLLTPILAFTIPQGQPNGVYQVSYSNGEEVHTLISATNGTTSAPSNSPSAKFRAKRQGSFACGGDSLDHQQTDIANNELDGQCGAGRLVGEGLDIYSIYDCTVAYYCNFGGLGYCTSQARQQASRGITGWCGWYRSGWTTGTSYSYGYENFCKFPGYHFCGRGP